MSDRFQHGDDLGGVIRALEGMAPPFDPPPDLKVRVLAAVESAATEEIRPAPERVERLRPRPRWFQRRVALVAASAAALIGIAIGIGIGTLGGDQQQPNGPLELAGELRATRGPATAQIDVRLLGSGREVTISSDSLPILPKGDYYEVWFVAPDGRRISAGTFHPDDKGHTDVVLHAAVDPKLFPRVEVTAERGDNAPGRVVLRLPR